jgi:glutamate/tyrosine decarboxylase-like PLP-dependent enzyme
VPDLSELLKRTAERVADYRHSVGERPVAPPVDLERLREALGGPLPAQGADPDAVIEQLALAVEPSLTASVGPRYYGFVVGGALDAATCADILATGWDQMAFNATSSPVAALVEDVVGVWLKEALGLPADASFGITTGAQGGNTVALAAARHRVLADAGWNVEARGLMGAPAIRVVAGEERHATVDRALRLLGMGADAVQPVAADANGAIDPEALGRALRDGGTDSPTIVCAQAGNVNTGACDDVAACSALARSHGAWLHVDGAFGMWAAASPSTRSLVDGIDGADSWAVDGHKWLNVPYDTGFVFCADRGANTASMSYTASYLEGQGGDIQWPSDFVPESSRRARGFASWAALRELGRDGLAELIDRCCAHARRFGERLAAIDGVEIGNEIVLNQVLASFGSDDRTDALIAAVQRDGTCWMGGTTWRGRRYMRISVSNWTTTAEDVDRSVTAIRGVLEETPS